MTEAEKFRELIQEEKRMAEEAKEADAKAIEEKEKEDMDKLRRIMGLI